MRKLLAIFFIGVILNTLSAWADEIFYASAEYNVNSARDAVADGVVFKLHKNTFKDKVYDTQNQQNLKNIVDGNLSLEDRTLAFFSDSTYGIAYKNDPYNIYYYDASGFLIYVDVKSNLEFPYNFYKYTPSGELVNMGIRVSKSETYIYSPDEKLIAHWVGNNAYNEKNQIIMKRRYSN